MTGQVANEKGDEVVIMHDHADDHETENENNAKSVTAGILLASLPKWLDATVVGFLIFGGCCGNVFALEAIIKDEPAAGPLITFVQFVTVSLFTIPSFLSWSAGASSLFMKAPVIPLRSWSIYTLFFVTVNLLNNWAFAYRISVPLHIILRSGGPVASMIIGYLYNGRRYSRMQIFSVMLLTLGVVAAALADAKAQGKAISLSSGEEEGKSTLTFVTGFTILALAMLLSAFQGVYADRLYATHGNTHWREALLYSHMLSLPFFLPTYTQLSSQFRAFMSSPSILADLHPAAAGSLPQEVIMNDAVQNATMSVSRHIAASLSSGVTPSSMAVVAAATPSALTEHSSNLLAQSGNSFSSILSASTESVPRDMITIILNKTPSKIFYLVINALTQYICIRGVYLLAAKSSSLTVTIVLNIRKLVSLLLSIYIFGNSLASGVLIGAGFVFLGGALYGVGSARAKSKKMNSAAANTELHYRHNNDDTKGGKRGVPSFFSAAKNNLSSSSLSMRETSPTRKRKVKV
ncbi:UPD-GlcNAc transporter (Mnn2-2), putative [Talaromyces stipitatus ATCC 10500]|uniref:UPD-GlcNAc transporter (Mnn2-2), putative n=1 Tax=Talaromyces stipitatus (strain ATCC 10500 / CBS 375.48 / QM 6759 / NRRL 1006) TaxID=441959 RepID=B8MG86_TALSN|nr:UPD-GlcNAc transporter (Mnn2-2), putative [Talaromyces stipitatus ATCC 10500]EED15953.1 UPD-GlcNAc transporter (Mnn2-2), putative [Talaromyces stipitatus ATCC 10500]